jgi:hypothetical protein
MISVDGAYIEDVVIRNTTRDIFTIFLTFFIANWPFLSVVEAKLTSFILQYCYYNIVWDNCPKKRKVNKYRGFSVYSMNKTGGRRKMFTISCKLI